MVKKVFVLLIICVCCFVLSGCEQTGIVTSTGAMGQRADAYKNYLPTNKKQDSSGSSVIYLGREYEKNTFGPTGIRFVFE